MHLEALTNSLENLAKRPRPYENPGATLLDDYVLAVRRDALRLVSVRVTCVEVGVA